MRVRTVSCLAGFALLATSPLIAQTSEQTLTNPDATAQGDVSVTIYQDDDALI